MGQLNPWPRNRRLSFVHVSVPAWCIHDDVRFYARKQLLLSAHLSHRNSVRPSVRLSVCLSDCHTGGSVKNSASWDHQIFTIGCLEDSSL